MTPPSSDDSTNTMDVESWSKGAAGNPGSSLPFGKRDLHFASEHAGARETLALAYEHLTTS